MQDMAIALEADFPGPVNASVATTAVLLALDEML